MAAPSAVAETLGIRYARADQPSRAISRFAHGPTPPGDEDCLFLNVWAAPAVAADVVVVMFTYRLGSLGWLASGVPTLGLLDHVAALRWAVEHRGVRGRPEG